MSGAKKQDTLHQLSPTGNSDPTPSNDARHTPPGISLPHDTAILESENDNWRAKVYKPRGIDSRFFASKKWRELRRRVMRRDCEECQRCGACDHLTVHHLIPLTEGGTNTARNLVTLCYECHDLAEENNLTLAQIKDYRAAIAEDALNLSGRPSIPAGNTDWRAWVYGGYRNPMKDKKYEITQAIG